MNISLRPRDLVAFAACAVITTVGLNAAATRWLGDTPTDRPAPPPNWIEVPNVITSLGPLHDSRPELLMIGNSHVYGLPGLQRGDPLRLENTKGTVFDTLAGRINKKLGPDRVLYCRLAYPNFLPIEMLISYQYLRTMGHHPRAVILGVSWGGFTRGRDARHDIRQCLQEDQVLTDLRQRIDAMHVPNGQDVLEGLEKEARRSHDDANAGQNLSDADQWENELMAYLDPRVALLGESGALRARLYRSFVIPIQDMWVRAGHATYGVVDEDLEFNMTCLQVLLQSLRDDGVQVLAYFAPRRTDISSMFESRRLDWFTAETTRLIHDNQFKIVDAGDLVRPDEWGWANDQPDMAHFVESAHDRLADMLWKEGDAWGLWTRLGNEGAADSPSPIQSGYLQRK
jgi:hypothetical protein